MKSAIFLSAILISGVLLQINGMEFLEKDSEAAGMILILLILADIIGFLSKRNDL